eukprot:jgi/Ulvmu1/1326/UM011_0054.1
MQAPRTVQSRASTRHACRRPCRRQRCVRAHASQVDRPQYVPGSISDPNYVRIFDTTLRDGEQSPGATLTSREKLDIARNLSKLGVDIIEAGFPFASPDDFAAVQQIAKQVGNEVDENGYVPVICGLSRTKLSDLDCAWDAVRHAQLPRVHTFIATSPIHMQYKLRMTEDQVVENAVAAVSHLKSVGCNDIEFSPEDAGRSERRFLYRILEAVIQAGATTLNIPDTTGWNMPAEFGGLIADLRAKVPGAESVVFSTHCQNDLGLSTANSLAGAAAGARQVECTINGIGERAGNASLEEVVMAIALRGADELGGLRTGINTRAIYPTSRMVSDFTGMLVQPHKAIVGANAFAHESGIHQDGMLKNASTYEIMTPESIGMSRAEADVGVVLGKHSGRNALRTKLASLGVMLDGESLDEVFKRFKELCDKKKRVPEEDVLALVSDEVSQVGNAWALEDLQVVCGTMGMPTATLKLRGPDGMLRVRSAVGTGPVDAAYKAVDSMVAVPADLMDYSITSVTEGIEALAATRVQIRPAGAVAEQGYKTTSQDTTVQRTFGGQGADSDIVVASTRAYVAALNKMIAHLSRDAGAPAAAEESVDAAEAASVA